MEIILFKKYLIRTDELCFRLESVKSNKPPIIEIKTNSKGEKYKSYSNFKVVGYYSNFSDCIKGIRRNELLTETDNITKLSELAKFIQEMDTKIQSELIKLRI